MHKNVEIRGFDRQNHEIYAVKDSDTDEVLGLVFQDDKSPFQTVMVAQKTEELASIDLLQAAQVIIEVRNGRG